MSWGRDWQEAPEALETQRAISKALMGEFDRGRNIAWQDVPKHIHQLVDAMKVLVNRVDELVTGKHRHEWRECWVAGAQDTRCHECGISIADHGLQTMGKADWQAAK